MAKNDQMNRRNFVRDGLKTTAIVSIAGIGGALSGRTVLGSTVWQIDPEICVQCEQCATACVLSPSAVKCVHAFDVCGYCDLCGGYLSAGVKLQDTAAENQLCPTGALIRNFVEPPFYEYTVDEDLCVGCAKCVKGCAAFGNGSLHLQVRHDICINCNECSIARQCPSDAFKRLPARAPYLFKGEAGKK